MNLAIQITIAFCYRLIHFFWRGGGGGKGEENVKKRFRIHFLLPSRGYSRYYLLYYLLVFVVVVVVCFVSALIPKMVLKSKFVFATTE